MISQNHAIIRTQTYHEYTLIKDFFEVKGQLNFEVIYINTFAKLECPPTQKKPKDFTIYCIDKRISKNRIANAGFDISKIVKGWKKSMLGNS